MARFHLTPIFLFITRCLKSLVRERTHRFFSGRRQKDLYSSHIFHSEQKNEHKITYFCVKVTKISENVQEKSARDSIDQKNTTRTILTSGTFSPLAKKTGYVFSFRKKCGSFIFFLSLSTFIFFRGRSNTPFPITRPGVRLIDDSVFLRQL